MRGFAAPRVPSAHLHSVTFVLDLTPKICIAVHFRLRVTPLAAGLYVLPLLERGSWNPRQCRGICVAVSFSSETDEHRASAGPVGSIAERLTEAYALPLIDFGDFAGTC